MLINRFVVSLFSFALVVPGATTVSGQDYPDKPIRIVAPGIGGGSDFSARLIAQGLTSSLSQQVVVDNRASGVIPGDIVSKAQPDGYTLLHAANTHWLTQFFQKDTPYDAVKDFAPIILAVSSPNLIVVHPAVAANSVKELIALAKAKPGMLNYASTGTGGSTHLAPELFNAMAGTKIVRINYKGSGPALSSLIAGEVQLMFSSTLSVIPHVKSGKLRALAITSAQPSALAPGLPTVAASGLPGYQSVAIYGVFAPAKTPSTIVIRLNQAIARVVTSADVKEKYLNVGAEVVAGSPAEFAAAIKSDMVRMGKVIRDAGIKAD